jgi:hypothetical protein
MRDTNAQADRDSHERTTVEAVVDTKINWNVN